MHMYMCMLLTTCYLLLDTYDTATLTAAHVCLVPTTTAYCNYYELQATSDDATLAELDEANDASSVSFLNI
eukprot:scaffold102107_cov45-Phaeocystis_antarctica.AAC.2